MRTTIDLNDELMRQAKRRAADEGITFKNLVERALRAQLQGRHAKTGYRFVWHTEGGSDPPTVDIDNRVALYDFMDPVEELRDRHLGAHETEKGDKKR